MKKRLQKIIHEGDYMAEVEVEFIYTSEPWSPYLSLEDAEKLDNVRLALQKEDLQSASKLARIYRLTPVF